MPGTLWPWLQAFIILWCFFYVFFMISLIFNDFFNFFHKGVAVILLWCFLCVFFNFVYKRTTSISCNFVRVLNLFSFMSINHFCSRKTTRTDNVSDKGSYEKNKKVLQGTSHFIWITAKSRWTRIVCNMSICYLFSWFFEFRLTWLLKTRKRDHD